MIQIMEKLLAKSRQKVNDIKLDFKRYLFNQINFDNRHISILGSRGTGKTTLLLQIAAEKKDKVSLYVALDDLFFTNSSLYQLAENFEIIGGNILLLDEVHKYPNWSREIKLIYDDFPKLQVIFSSSSILDIYKAESDLSRRVISYILKEMSFREFLLFQHKIDLPQVNLNQLLQNHESISIEISSKLKPLKYFLSTDKKYYKSYSRS